MSELRAADPGGFVSKSRSTGHLSILGGRGQVGAALAARARRDGVPVKAAGRAECDITDRAAVAAAVAGSGCVVNCAAYTAVDRAEADAQAAHRVNALGARNVAVACAAAGIPLVHLSTDYVFEGAGERPLREDDPRHPVNVYGATKLAGEDAVRECARLHIILRTSWIFSARGQNFLKSVLRIAQSEPRLPIVYDQVGGPTPADDIARAILVIVSAAGGPGFADWGTYHFCGAPPVSWCGFADQILLGTGAEIVPVSSRELRRPARRPRNSVLDCSRILSVFGIEQPDWRLAIAPIRNEVMHGR
jgi:dTDP-4-dehydrorhamnose reductase